MPDVPIPDGYRERIESLVGGRRDLLVVVAVVGAIIAGVLLLRLRTPPPQIAPPSTTPPSATVAAPTQTPSGEIFVHVAGAVRRPGLYAMPAGSRVADALEAAGGARRHADLDAINLAEPLADGAKIDVPGRSAAAPASTPATPAPPSPTPGATSATPAPTTIDINTADAATLETISGIGPVLAGAIVQHRDENGPFPSVDALLDVSGIGPATLEAIRPYVTV